MGGATGAELLFFALLGVVRSGGLGVSKLAAHAGKFLQACGNAEVDRALGHFALFVGRSGGQAG